MARGGFRGIKVHRLVSLISCVLLSACGTPPREPRFASDADCRASEYCRQLNRCWNRGGKCVRISGETPHRQIRQQRASERQSGQPFNCTPTQFARFQKLRLEVDDSGWDEKMFPNGGTVRGRTWAYRAPPVKVGSAKVFLHAISTYAHSRARRSSRKGWQKYVAMSVLLPSGPPEKSLRISMDGFRWITAQKVSTGVQNVVGAFMYSDRQTLDVLFSDTPLQIEAGGYRLPPSKLLKFVRLQLLIFMACDSPNRQVS